MKPVQKRSCLLNRSSEEYSDSAQWYCTFQQSGWALQQQPLQKSALNSITEALSLSLILPEWIFFDFFQTHDIEGRHSAGAVQETKPSS